MGLREEGGGVNITQCGAKGRMGAKYAKGVKNDVGVCVGTKLRCLELDALN